ALQTLIAYDAHVNLAAGDVLLSDRVGLGLAMNEIDALRELCIVVHDRCARDSLFSFFAARFDEQRELQPLRTLDYAIHVKDGERRYMDAVISEHHFRERLIAANGQASRIATRVRLLHQFEIADDVLIVKWVAVKLFEQIESDVRFVF